MAERIYKRNLRDGSDRSEPDIKGHEGCAAFSVRKCSTALFLFSITIDGHRPCISGLASFCVIAPCKQIEGIV